MYYIENNDKIKELFRKGMKVRTREGNVETVENNYSWGHDTLQILDCVENHIENDNR